MDMNTIRESFKGFTLEDLKTIQGALTLEIKSRNEEAKIVEKQSKEAAKAAGISLKDSVVVGSIVSFTYKGGVKTGRVDKVTEKTFHINAEEFGLDYVAGKQLFRYIQFAHLVSIANVTADAPESDAPESDAPESVAPESVAPESVAPESALDQAV